MENRWNEVTRWFVADHANAILWHAISSSEQEQFDDGKGPKKGIVLT